VSSPVTSPAFVGDQPDLAASPGEVIFRDMITCGKATDLFLGDLVRRGYSKRTIDTYRRILDQLCDRLPPDIDVSKVTTDDCRRFLDKWNAKAAGTRAHAFSVLSSFFKWLYHTERIKRSPMDRLERPKRLPAEDLDVGPREPAVPGVPLIGERPATDSGDARAARTDGPAVRHREHPRSTLGAP
jgi:integrase family protein with SAM-like domain